MTDAATTWSLVAAGTFVAGLVGVRLVEQHARALGLVDLPNTRSSHVVPRPRGGGLGIVAGVVLGAAGASASGLPFGRDIWIVISAALLVAVVGLWDDVRGLGVWPRLAVQSVAAIAVVATAGGLDHLPLPAPAELALGALGSIATVIWIVGVTNFFNFMDGLDGLAAGQAVITFAAFAWVVWPAGAAGFAMICAGASAAFLLRNWSPARIFLGDVGSAFLGFLLSALPLATPERSRSPLVLLVGISLALFLLDPIATLISRVRRGAVIGASHREHAYQQFVSPAASHASVVARLLLAGAALSTIAVAATSHPVLGWPAVAAALVAFVIEWHLAGRRRLAPLA